MNQQVNPYSAPDGASSRSKFLSLPNTPLEWFVILAILGIVVALILPPVTSGGGSSRRMQCKNNLKQIGLALHNYHDVCECFPPAVVPDDQGRPAHSWRVLLLPFLEQQALYDRYSFDEPWDGPNNAKLVDSMPEVFACPTFSDSKLGAAKGANRLTTYMAINDTGAAFDGPKTRSIQDFPDGEANTVMVTEVRQFANVWMSPTDVSISQWQAELRQSSGQKAGSHKNGIQVLMANGSARFVSHDTDTQSIAALTSTSGDDKVSDECQ